MEDLAKDAGEAFTSGSFNKVRFSARVSCGGCWHEGEEGLKASEEAKCTSAALRRSADLSFSDLNSARESEVITIPNTPMNIHPSSMNLRQILGSPNTVLTIIFPVKSLHPVVTSTLSATSRSFNFQ